MILARNTFYARVGTARSSLPSFSCSSPIRIFSGVQLHG